MNPFSVVWNLLVLKSPSVLLPSLMPAAPVSGPRRLARRAQAVGRLLDATSEIGEYSHAGMLKGRQAMRDMARRFDRGYPKLARREDTTLTYKGNAIPIRIYDTKASNRNRPLLIYYHGGGWALGDLETHDGPCGRIAHKSGATVISVDYRLAPEHPFPAGFDDALAAYQGVRQHARRLRLEPSGIGVGGDSAGGNLSAAVCVAAKNRGITLPDFQILIYPVTDMHADSASFKEFANGIIVTSAGMRYYRSIYMKDLSLDDPRVSPLCAKSLRGQPPALVMTAGFDALRDEGNAYAERLAAEGNQVSHVEYLDQIHGFMALQKLAPETVDDAERRIALFVRKHGAARKRPRLKRSA